MTEAKAHLNNYRQAPRKVRLVADAVRGKKVDDAITTLSFIPKRAALPVQKLLASVLANAKNLSIPADNLIIKEIRVDAGSTLFRRRPRSRGMANPIRKRTSRVSITLTDSRQSKSSKASDQTKKQPAVASKKS